MSKTLQITKRISKQVVSTIIHKNGSPPQPKTNVSGISLFRNLIVKNTVIHYVFFQVEPQLPQKGLLGWIHLLSIFRKPQQYRVIVCIEHGNARTIPGVKYTWIISIYDPTLSLSPHKKVKLIKGRVAKGSCIYLYLDIRYLKDLFQFFFCRCSYVTKLCLNSKQVVLPFAVFTFLLQPAR